MSLADPQPGHLFPWVRRAAWLESAIFAGLLVVWLVPGMEGATTAFGWAHGIGYLGLLGLLLAAVIRNETPFWVLLATFNPLGPFGTAVALVVYDASLRRRERPTAPA